MPLRPWRHRVLPHEFQIALKMTRTDERTGGQTTQAATKWPLLEFNANLPMFAAQLYQIYRFARITAIHLQMEVVNTSSTQPLTCVMCVLPLVRVNAITDPRAVSDVPNAITKQVGLSTGMSRVVLNKTYVSQKELGQSILSGSEFTQTYSEALSAASQDDFPSIYAGVIASSTGGNWTGIIKYVAIYHLEFSEYDSSDIAVRKPNSEMIVNPKHKGKVLRVPPTGELGEEDLDESEESWAEQPPLTRAKVKKVTDESRIKGSNAK